MTRNSPKDDQEAFDLLRQALAEDKRPPTAASLHPAFAVGAGIFCLVNVGILLSLPPVLRGRGAPYLPIFQKSVDTMFSQLRKDPHLQTKLNAGDGTRLTFVDLGSGDGRVVFRAAREGIFDKCIGYEINPLLHLWASSRRLIQASRYKQSTEFHLQDLWNVDLSEVDVVAVYGLNPIMKDLGVKLQEELRPGSVVLSNVFAIPGWKQSTLSSSGVHVYSVPACWGDDNESNTRQPQK